MGIPDRGLSGSSLPGAWAEHPGLPAVLQGQLHTCNECVSARAHARQALTPPRQHLGTTGWAGDEPAAFNSGFMVATDPKLTSCHYSV